MVKWCANRRHPDCGDGVLHLHGQPHQISAGLCANPDRRPATNICQDCCGAARHLSARLRLGAAFVRPPSGHSPPVPNDVAHRAAVQRGGHHAGHQLFLLHAVAEERLDGAAFQKQKRLGQSQHQQSQHQQWQHQQSQWRGQLAARVSGHAGELPRGPGFRHCRDRATEQRLLLKKFYTIAHFKRIILYNQQS